MDTKKFLLATLAAFIGMFVVSWLVYTVIFEGYFEEAFKELPTRETPLMGILVLSQIGLALIMAFMYPKGYEGARP